MFMKLEVIGKIGQKTEEKRSMGASILVVRDKIHHRKKV